MHKEVRSDGATRHLQILSTIAIVAIVAVSVIVYIVHQSASEEQVRISVFNQYEQRQVLYAKSVAQNMQSELELLMGSLETIAFSKQVQDGNLDDENIDVLLENAFENGNRISNIDGVYIIDHNDHVVNYHYPGVDPATVLGLDVSALAPVIEYRNNLPKSTYSNVYTSVLDNKSRIALIHPIYLTDTGEHVGGVSMVLGLDSFFSRHGNIQEIESQYLAALDSNGTVMTSAARDIVGRNVFSEYVYNLHDDKSAYDHYEKVMAGNPSVAVFGFKTGERMNIGEPVILNGNPQYSLFVVTPSAAIYGEIDKVLATQRTQTHLFLGIIIAAISLSIFFMARWNTSLSRAVRSRTSQLEKANKELETHDKLQREFINIAAHELRTPIQPIIGITEIISSKLNGNENVDVSREDIELLDRNAKRLERLSSDLLQVARIESGSMDLALEPIDISAKVMNVIANAKTLLRDRNEIEIIYHAPKETIIVRGDKTKLFEVFSNLIGNALKFTEKGTITIGVEKATDGNEVVISVRDTGRGIDPEIFPKLFGKFNTKSSQGSGLGLFIAKSIVEAHDGRIWAENNSGANGATFKFTLPLAKNKDNQNS